MNIGLTVTRVARRRPNSAAIITDRGVVTYAELDRATNRLAAALIGHWAVSKGDRVALFVANRPEVVEVMLGCCKAGATYVGLNFRLDRSDLEAIFDNAEPRLVLSDAEHVEMLAEICTARGIPLVNIDSQKYAAALQDGSSELPPGAHDVAHTDDFCIVYTSGTTGVPKGVLFDHAASMQHGLAACLEYGIDENSRYLVQIPHNSSVNITVVPCLMAGAALTFTDSRGFDPVAFADHVAAMAVTHSFVVPTMLYRVLEKVPQASKLASLQTLGYGSAPIPKHRLSELVSRFGGIFNQLYGMAEIASIGTILSKESHLLGLSSRPELLGSAGQQSYAVDVLVVNDEGQEVGVGEQGEIIFSGPHIMKGYFRDPKRTEETLQSGWIHSGDIAKVDEQGYFYIVDRKKDLVIRGGLNIAPREVEEVLLRHPAIREAAVIGIPDEEWGEAVLGVVSFRDDVTAETSELLQWCRSAGLASIKVPERIEVMSELPKNAVGKVEKQQLRRAKWSGERRV